MVLTIQLLELWVPCKARWAWAPYKAPLKPDDCLPLVAQRLVPEKGAGKKATGKRVKKTGVGFCFIGIASRHCALLINYIKTLGLQEPIRPRKSIDFTCPLIYPQAFYCTFPPGQSGSAAAKGSSVRL